MATHRHISLNAVSATIEQGRTWMTIWLRVRVPVLSEHSSVMPAISSIAVSRVTIAPCAASCRDPKASVVVLQAPHTKSRSHDLFCSRYILDFFTVYAANTPYITFKHVLP